MESRIFKQIVIAVLVTLTVSTASAQVAKSSSQPHYTVIDLGTPLGGSFAIGTSINLFGSVGGYANLSGDNAQHAVLRLNGSVIDLGTLGGNDSALYGTYSGFSETSDTDPLGQDFCAYGDFLVCRPFVVGLNAIVGLPTLGGNSAVAFNNNDFGQVVGSSQTSSVDPTCPVPPVPPFYEVQVVLPARWENGRAEKLPVVPGDIDGQATGINDLGETIGNTGTCLNLGIHAVLWKNGKLTNLGSLGGVTGSGAAGINNFGEVTGNSDLTGDSTFHAYLWRGGRMTDLGTLPGDYYSYGNAINDAGQIVGESCDINFNCRPFLWQKGTMFDLNSLVLPNSNLYLLYAATINDFGEITGYAYDQTSGTLPAFLAVQAGHASTGGVMPDEIGVRPIPHIPDSARAAIRQGLNRGRSRMSVMSWFSLK